MALVSPADWNDSSMALAASCIRLAPLAAGIIDVLVTFLGGASPVPMQASLVAITRSGDVASPSDVPSPTGGPLAGPPAP